MVRTCEILYLQLIFLKNHRDTGIELIYVSTAYFLKNYRRVKSISKYKDEAATRRRPASCTTPNPHSERLGVSLFNRLKSFNRGRHPPASKASFYATPTAGRPRNAPTQARYSITHTSCLRNGNLASCIRTMRLLSTPSVNALAYGAPVDFRHG